MVAPCSIVTLPSMLSQTIVIPDGLGLLDIRGQGETALLVQGKPFYFAWCAYDGTLADYLMRFTSDDDARTLLDFRNALTDLPINCPSSVLFSKSLAPLLRTLASGTYTLTVQQTEKHRLEFIDFNWTTPSADPLWVYLEGTTLIVPTQPDAALSPSRVDHFRNLIASGFTPIAITLTTSCSPYEFIIDGHHKLAAYLQSGRPFTRLVITRHSSPYINIDDARAYFPHGHSALTFLENSLPVLNQIRIDMGYDIATVMDCALRYACNTKEAVYWSIYSELATAFPGAPQTLFSQVQERAHEFALALPSIAKRHTTGAITFNDAQALLASRFPDFPASSRDQALQQAIQKKHPD
jgi:hypothetical protein